MKASKWIIEKLIELFKDKGSKENLDEMNKIFSKYPKDHSLVKIHKDFKAYQKKPTKEVYDSLSKILQDTLKTRKFETSGGTRLWFGDRRTTRNSQMSR